MDKCYQFLITVCNSPKFMAVQSSEEAKDAPEDTKSAIIIANLGKLLKIMSHLCKYSSEHSMIAVTEMHVLQLIESLLKREYSKSKDTTSVLTETISLLSALIPDSR